jgi:hypothetical protein
MQTVEHKNRGRSNSILTIPKRASAMATRLKTSKTPAETTNPSFSGLTCPWHEPSCYTSQQPQTSSVHHKISPLKSCINLLKDTSPQSGLDHVCFSVCCFLSDSGRRWGLAPSTIDIHANTPFIGIHPRIVPLKEIAADQLAPHSQWVCMINGFLA